MRRVDAPTRLEFELADAIAGSLDEDESSNDGWLTRADWKAMALPTLVRNTEGTRTPRKMR